jgi:signal transduction histidine kinase
MGHTFSIFTKGLLILGIPAIAQLLFLALLWVMRAEHSEAEKWAIHTSEVVADMESTYRLVLVARVKMLGYILTEDVEYLHEYRGIRDRFGSAVGKLRDLVADNPPQQTQADQIKSRAELLFKWLDDLGAKPRDVALAELRGQHGYFRSDDLRETVEEFLQVERNLAAQRNDVLQSVGHRQFWILVGGGLASTVGAAIMVLLFSRSIVGRLNVLMENAGRMATGKPMAPPLGGADEISQLDRVFHDTAEALAQKDRDNSMFVYSVSHDLRSPLVNLQGFSQELTFAARQLRHLLDQPSVPDTARQPALKLIDLDMAESIRFIHTGVARLEGIIDALLRLSRAGKVEYSLLRVEVQSIVGRILESMQSTIQHQSIEVVVGELPPVLGDPGAIELIFANLIGNAIAYLDPHRRGKIEVGCIGAEADRDGRRRFEPGCRVYFVRDNGRGIPSQFLSKIFLAFQRLHADAPSGEGIGLALVQRVVERHGGKVGVESTEGQGSTFFVALPAAGRPAPALELTKNGAV